MKLYQFFTGFFPEFHFCPTGDFDFPAGFHRSPAVISTSEWGLTVVWGLHRQVMMCGFPIQVGADFLMWGFRPHCELWYCEMSQNV